MANLLSCRYCPSAAKLATTDGAENLLTLQPVTLEPVTLEPVTLESVTHFTNSTRERTSSTVVLDTQVRLCDIRPPKVVQR
jgi:hypothetical protein